MIISVYQRSWSYTNMDDRITIWFIWITFSIYKICVWWLWLVVCSMSGNLKKTDYTRWVVTFVCFNSTGKIVRG